jgi:hypothetical protein
MYINGLAVTLHDGHTLDDDVIDEMLALRAQFMRLQPDIDPDVDRTLFADWMRAPGNTVAIARDRADTLHTFIEMNTRRITQAGKAHLMCYGNFVFASPAYRNHPAYTLGNFWNLATQTRRNRERPTAWVVAVYPTAFNSGARTFPDFWALGEPEVPKTLSELARKLAHDVFGDNWFPDELLVRQRTLPPPFSVGSDESKALLARYEARNPNWRDGWALACVLPITASNMLGAATLAVRRMGQRATMRPRNRPG